MMKPTEKKKSRKAKLEKTAYFLSKKVGRAIADYGMINDGDRILVAVSGGKDSLSLLKILDDRRSFVPITYELVAVYIDMGDYHINAKRLAGYFKKHGYKYHIKKIRILKGKGRADISCFWCAWNRRKALFNAAEEYGCNKVALGHHKDDIIETILMNIFFNGEISAMGPKQELFKGKIAIIRPLAYAQEKEIVHFSRLIDFPHSKCRCPNSSTSQRAKMGVLIRALEKMCPNVKSNIFNSVKRIKKEYLL